MKTSVIGLRVTVAVRPPKVFVSVVLNSASRPIMIMKVDWIIYNGKREIEFFFFPRK